MARLYNPIHAFEGRFPENYLYLLWSHGQLWVVRMGRNDGQYVWIMKGYKSPVEK